MSTVRPFIIECRFKDKGTTFRKYLDATSIDDAMKLAAEPGSVPVRAWPADDSAAAEAAELSRKLSKLEAELKLVREDLGRVAASDMITHPYWTVICGVMIGGLVWTIIALLLRAAAG